MRQPGCERKPGVRAANYEPERLSYYDQRTRDHRCAMRPAPCYEIVNQTLHDEEVGRVGVTVSYIFRRVRPIVKVH